jgi:hypothetical protein
LFALAFLVHSLGFLGSLDRHRLDGAKKLSRHRGIDTQTAEREASGQPEHQIRTIATVNGLTRRTARVTYHQTAPAPSTGEQPCQQSAPAASRLRPSQLAIGIDRKLLLVPFELGPVDIAVVVILQQNRPLSEWLAVAVAGSGTSVDDLGALLAFAVGIDARIERVRAMAESW